MSDRRAAFAPSPLPPLPAGGAANPAPPLISFAALSISVGLAWTTGRLAACALAVGFYLIWPSPSARPLRILLRFLPLLLLVPLLSLFAWRGFDGQLRSPWLFLPDALPRGLAGAARMGLWILVSARCLESLHPAALLARLPRSARWARRLLVPLLAFSFLDLMIREAWLLERAWRARGGAGRVGGGRLAAHWPSLILPLFRNLLARADTLAEALELRRFPDRWAGAPARGILRRDLYPAIFAALVCLAFLTGTWG